MDERQLRDLLRLTGKLGMQRVARQFLAGRRSDQASTTEDLGVDPGDGMDSRQRAELRVDDIIRSLLGDRSGRQFAPAEESNRPADLKATIAGAVETQDAVGAGQQPPIDQPKVLGIDQSAAPGISPSMQAEVSKPKQPSRTANAVDALQLVLDVVGAFDPTPITDGANAAISLGRAFVTDPERRKEHLQNAAISTVSMIPYIGDTAKLAKVPRAAKTVQRTTQAVRGTDRAADGAKVMTAAEKRTAREAYRETAEQATSVTMGSNDTDGAAAPALNRPAAGGDGGQPPIQSPPVMTPPGPDDNRGPQARTEEAEGVEEYYGWREAIKDSGKKLTEFGGVLGKGVLKVAAFVQGLSLLNTGVLALNRDLAAYNGQIASGYARSDAADIRRDMRKADAMSDPLSGLADEQTELKDTISRLTIPMQAIGTGILEKTTSLVNWTARITGVIEPGVAALEWLASFFGKQGNNGNDTAWRTFFQDVSDGKFDGKRPTFLNPKSQILNDADHQEVFGP